jgi:hypothetical protein
MGAREKVNCSCSTSGTRVNLITPPAYLLIRNEGGINSMGVQFTIQGVNIPWESKSMNRGVDIPLVGGQNSMGSGSIYHGYGAPYTIGRGSKYHG